MIKLFIIAFLSFTSSFCAAQNGLEKLEASDDGITVEKADPANPDENRYNHNNSIYKPGRKFTFSYAYSDTAGVKFLMAKGSMNKQNMYDWEFEKMDKKDSNSVFQIILSVKSGLSPFIKDSPDYTQTVISYGFKLLSGDSLNFTEITGLIENEKNTWIHPPRTGFFKILEINPFPYMKEPLAIGNKWAWRLRFGSHWADKRWMAWEGVNENIYNYEITGKAMLQTKLGNIECFVISANAKSKLGETKLTSYFNRQFGFVKLDYTNIDGSKTIIELEKME